MQIDHTPQIENDKWPDFYAILDAAPELDDKELRRIISDCYQQASNKIDHRDLSVRFYNQVLTQKVLPACRRILLNPEMRALYNEQLRLHRAGAIGAISYHQFVVEVTHTKSTCLLHSSELSILPSIDGQASQAPLQALKVPGMPQKNRIEIETTTVRMESSIASVAPMITPDKAKKPLPLAAIAAVAVLLLGAGGWLLTRSSPKKPDAEAVAVTAAKPPRQPTPPRMKLNTLAQNSDFEDKNSGAWVISTTTNGAFLDDAYNNDAKSGGRVLNFWTDKVPAGQPSKTARVSQQISNLENGTYTLKAWMRRAGRQKEFYMFASDYGGSQRKVDADLPVFKGWTPLTLSNIRVTNGKCTIGFYGDNVDQWVNVDAVEFYRS